MRKSHRSFETSVGRLGCETGVGCLKCPQILSTSCLRDDRRPLRRSALRFSGSGCRQGLSQHRVDVAWSSSTLWEFRRCTGTHERSSHCLGAFLTGCRDANAKVRAFG